MPEIHAPSFQLTSLSGAISEANFEQPLSNSNDSSAPPNYEGSSPWNGSDANNQPELSVANIQQARLAPAAENPALTEAKLKTQMTLVGLAADKNTFREFFKKIYGDRYDANVVEKMRQEFLVGDFSSLPEFRIVSSDSLHGNHAAYGDGVVYLNEELLQDPEQLVAYMLEEAAHHFDTFFGVGDAKGDEGELFRRTLAGEDIDSSELDKIKNENDSGTINVDGKEINVEFGVRSRLKKRLKKLKKAIKKFVDAVVDFVKAVIEIVKLIVRVIIFVFDYAINGEAAVDRLEQAFKDALIALMQSKLLQWIITAIVTFFTAGTMTGPLLVMMEGIKQGLMAAIKQAIIEYVKQQIINYIVQEVAEATGSEWLGAVVGAFVSGQADMSQMMNNFQQSLSNITTEQLVELAKDEVKQQVTEMILEKIAEEVDFKPLQIFLSNWVKNGADLNELNTTIEGFTKQLTTSTSTMSWDKMLDVVKDKATDVALDKIEEKTGFVPGKNDIGTWMKDGAYLDRVPELLGKMQDGVKDEVSEYIIERVSKEVGSSTLRDALAAWVKDGANFDKLPGVLAGFKNVFENGADSKTLDEILSKAKNVAQDALIEKIQDQVRYKPLQTSLIDWVNNGAKPSDLDDVIDAVKNDIGKKIDKVETKVDAGVDKISAMFGKVFGENTKQNDLSASRDLLSAINQAETNKTTGASPSEASFVEAFKAASQQAAATDFNKEILVNFPDGPLKEKLSALANSGSSVSQGSFSSAESNVLFDLTKEVDLSALKNILSEWSALQPKLNSILAKAEDVSDRFSGGDEIKSLATKVRGDILPEMSKAAGVAAGMVLLFEQTRENANKKERRLQTFQSFNRAAGA